LSWVRLGRGGLRRRRQQGGQKKHPMNRGHLVESIR
jgi:hypothetical protein